MAGNRIHAKTDEKEQTWTTTIHKQQQIIQNTKKMAKWKFHWNTKKKIV